MKRFKNRFTCKDISDICNFRLGLKTYNNQVLSRMSGVVFGLKVSSKITNSSYYRMICLIEKIENKQIISLR